jgi:hypothetical protein
MFSVSNTVLRTLLQCSFTICKLRSSQGSRLVSEPDPYFWDSF